jgi:hypothetical protein
MAISTAMTPMTMRTAVKAAPRYREAVAYLRARRQVEKSNGARVGAGCDAVNARDGRRRMSGVRDLKPGLVSRLARADRVWTGRAFVTGLTWMFMVALPW